MIFEPPTDKEKEQWANAETVERAEFGGNVYELSAAGTVFALEREGAKPSKKKEVGFLKLVGVIPTPTPVLIDNIKQASDWRVS